MRRLARSEGGFGLIELLIAMTVMVIAIMGIVAAFSSGLFTLNRASHTSTAGAVADIQMEAYHRGQWSAISPTCPSGTSAATDCFVSSTKTGPDGRTYRVDVSVKFDCAVGTLGGTVPSAASCTGTGAARPAKLVTVKVYDPSTSPVTQLFQENSTFDQATG